MAIPDDFSGSTGTFDGIDLAFTAAQATSAVPEPGTWTLLATGLAASDAGARRRRRSGGRA